MRHLMPQNGQIPTIDPAVSAGLPLAVLSLHTQAAGQGRLSHRHNCGQFYYLKEGLTVIETATGRLLSLPMHFGWIPPGVIHSAGEHGDLKGWTAYVRADLCREMPPEPATLEGSPLMLIILERLSDWPEEKYDARHDHLLKVLLDEIKAAKHTSIRLPYPADQALAQMVIHLLDNPDDKRSIKEWSKEIGRSERNFSRKFVSETGLSFAKWRRLARILKAQEMLADGMMVQEAAWNVGYENVSAFIDQFKQVFGYTPGEMRLMP